MRLLSGLSWLFYSARIYSGWSEAEYEPEQSEHMRGDYYPALRIYFSLAGRVPVSGDPHAPV